MPSSKFDATPISLSVCDIQPISEYPESVNCSPRPSVTLQMVAAKKLSMSSRRSSRSLNIDNDKQWAQERLGKRRCAKTVSMACVSYRLTKRKELHRLCCQISDVTSVLAMIGMLLMVIDSEFMFNQVRFWTPYHSWFTKLLISITTLVLMVFIVYFHYYDIRLYCVNNSIEHWRVGLTGKKLFVILLELFICGIHPFPRYLPKHTFSMQQPQIVNATTSSDSSASSNNLNPVPFDIYLSLPLFARIYLWCRSITFHSRMVRDMSSQSLGYLNKVAIDFDFVIKTYFQQYPSRCLVIFCTVIFIIGSWALRACDLKSDQKRISMFDAMWFFMVTFTTVGYGDLTPATHCARVVATMVSIIGILVAALLIAIVSQKLTLSRREKYVHKFLLSGELAKARINESANIIIYAWKMWYLRKNDKHRTFEYVQTQRKFFRTVVRIQQIKQKQRVLVDRCVDLIDLLMAQCNTNTTVENIVEEVTTVRQEINRVEKKLDDMCQMIEKIHLAFTQPMNSATVP